VTSVREARPGERAAVRNVVDGAALALEPARLGAALNKGEVLVAIGEETDQLLGVLVLDGDRIHAVAVRPNRRGQGIGTALVEAAAERRDRLVADFEPAVRPFWESLGFRIETVGDRHRGVR
jgi:GNAT superfamily N-acetyltransferase